MFLFGFCVLSAAATIRGRERQRETERGSGRDRGRRRNPERYHELGVRPPPPWCLGAFSRFALLTGFHHHFPLNVILGLYNVAFHLPVAAHVEHRRVDVYDNFAY